VAAMATALAVRKEIRRTRVNDSTLPLNSFFLRPLLRKVYFVCANLWLKQKKDLSGDLPRKIHAFGRLPDFRSVRGLNRIHRSGH